MTLAGIVTAEYGIARITDSTDAVSAIPFES